MKKIAITSLAITLAIATLAQERKLPKPPNPPKPPVEKAITVFSTHLAPPPPPVVQLPPPPPFAPLPSVPPLPNDVPADYLLFLQRNPDIRSVSWDKEWVIIKLKTGKEDRYNRDDENSMKSASAKYGDIPEAPPLPPQAPSPAEPTIVKL